MLTEKESKVSILYLCHKSEPGVWAVGSYTDTGEWTQESRWNSAAEAMEHVHRLNRGDNSDDIEDFSPKQ
jgi:hypothetical protein